MTKNNSLFLDRLPNGYDQAGSAGRNGNQFLDIHAQELPQLDRQIDIPDALILIDHAILVVNRLTVPAITRLETVR